MSQIKDTVTEIKGGDMSDESKNQKQILPKEYGCEIVLEKTTLDEVKNPSFPTDAYLIWYMIDNVEYLDLTRCSKKTNLFDMYYDKYGSGSIMKIDFGYGKKNPKFWGEKITEKKKK